MRSPSRSSQPPAPAAKASAAARSASSVLGAATSMQRQRPFALATLALLLCTTPGCYLAHLAEGQTRLLLARRPAEAVLVDERTPPHVAERLRLVARVRDFGARLGLDVDGQYTSYAPWPGDRLVTSVVATRPGEIEPAGFWFPLVGRVPYKGFFEEARAEAEARALRAKGLDTCLVPVVAYSTLGWLDDPLTDPLLGLERGRLVETLLHELVHATLFAPSQADFNEGVATFVGQEAAVRFAEAEPASPDEPGTIRARVEDDRAIASLLGEFREIVKAIYEEEDDPARRAEKRREAEAAARRRLASLPLRTAEPATLPDRVRWNDACQALSGTYEADLPLYADRLAALGGDLRAFLAEARRAAEAPDPRVALRGPGEPAPASLAR
jgi:predicted aminopeptidase